jgi:hypothetical protein
LKTTEKDGTDPQPITDYLNGEDGVSAELRMFDHAGADVDDAALAEIERAVDRGEPTIVDLQAWQDVNHVADLKPWATDWDDGHYIVLVGYDDANLFFMDPSTKGHYAYIPKGEFVERWHDVVGADNVHTYHAAIFVHTQGISPTPATPSGEAYVIY